MKFEDTFVKISKHSSWLCHAVTGHAYTYSRIRTSEFFETVREQVKKARGHQPAKAHEQANNKAKSQDEMALLTGSLGASYIKPSRSRDSHVHVGKSKVQTAAAKLAAHFLMTVGTIGVRTSFSWSTRPRHGALAVAWCLCHTLAQTW